MIWLGRGITGDDTHGHVDDISRFVAADTVLTAVEANKSDANHEPLQENLRRLRAATDLQGRKLQIVELPLPAPGRLSRTAAARQLRQFLYRQRTGAGADLQRSQRSPRAQYSG